MFGAPGGGFCGCGHHGFEPAMVLPMVPPNGGLSLAPTHAFRSLRGG
jgi:hypothetical protein